MMLENVDKEWLEAYVSEQKSLYGETPSTQEILVNWERNKEYFYTRKGKPFLTISNNS